MNYPERYIIMCEKATELQEQWEPKNYDYVEFAGNPLGFDIMVEIDWTDGRKTMSPLCVATSANSLLEAIPDPDRSQLTWIPRQDQLQEMMEENFRGFQFYGRVSWFKKFVDKAVPMKYKSWEIAWLMFVMKYKYNKVWDSKHELWYSECKTCGGYGALPDKGGYDTKECPDCENIRWMEVA